MLNNAFYIKSAELNFIAQCNAWHTQYMYKWQMNFWFWLQLSAAESYQEMSTFLKEQSESGAGGETVEETAR